MEEISDAEWGARKAGEREPQKLSRGQIDSLAQDPHLLELLLDGIIRNPKALNAFAEALAETDPFQEAVDDATRASLDSGN